MRIASIDELFEVLDRTVAGHERGDKTRADAAGFWERLLRTQGHPLATPLPDEPLVDWHARGLRGDVTDARVLDVGCGNGRNGRWLAEHGARVVGVDLAAAVLDEVRPDLPHRMEVHALDVLRDPLPAGPFDLVYDSGCFHHLAPHRRITYLQRILPLLAPGGRYAIVAFSQERQPSIADGEMLATGDTAGGTSFLLSRGGRVLIGVPLRQRSGDRRRTHPEHLRDVRVAVPLGPHPHGCGHALGGHHGGPPADPALERWIGWARRCRIPAFVELQRRIVKHKASILAAIEHGLSNGRIESVNTKIRLITRVAFGFKSPEALIALAMLNLGGH